LNKKEKALANLEYLKHNKLRSEMFRLNIMGSPDSLEEELFGKEKKIK